jgi:hypothetical protein
MKKLVDYLREKNAVSVDLVKGPNGDFISATMADGQRFTLPVGKKSQNGRLSEMNVIFAEDGGVIATMNNYSVSETLDLLAVGVTSEAVN